MPEVMGSDYLILNYAQKKPNYNLNFENQRFMAEILQGYDMSFANSGNSSNMKYLS